MKAFVETVLVLRFMLKLKVLTNSQCRFNSPRILSSERKLLSDLIEIVQPITTESLRTLGMKDNRAELIEAHNIRSKCIHFSFVDDTG